MERNQVSGEKWERSKPSGQRVCEATYHTLLGNAVRNHIEK
jgi:hypothetical protein